jgi:cobalt-zinc-cadmium efflux system membrane fusion protein
MSTAAIRIAVLVSLGALASLAEARPPAPQAQAPAELVPGKDAALRVSPTVVIDLGIQVTEVVERGPGKPSVLNLTGTLSYRTDELFGYRGRLSGDEVGEIGKVTEGTGSRPLKVGDKVKQGDLLFVLWSRELGEKKAAFVDALQRLRLSQEAAARMQQLADKGTVPFATADQATHQVVVEKIAVARVEQTLRIWKTTDAEMDGLRREAELMAKDRGKRDLKKQAADWSRVELRARADGTVIELNARAGTIVNDRENLCIIARVDRLDVSVAVTGNELRWLRTLPQDQYRWELRPQVEPAAAPIDGKFTLHRLEEYSRPSRTAAVQVKERFFLFGSVENAAGKLWAGQPVRVTIRLAPPAKDAAKPQPAAEVAVPASAVVEQGGDHYVFVQPEPGKPTFHRLRVVVVRRGTDEVHLRARPSPKEEQQGLRFPRPGEWVVTTGALELQATFDDLSTKAKR